MLIDGADHLRAVRSLIPRHLRLEATLLFREIARAHRGWAFASLCNVTSSSVMLGTGLYLIGIPGAFLLGFVAGLGELIPNFGPVIAAMPAILVALLANPDKFVWVVGLFIVVDSIQGWTISPHMMKFSVKLPVLVTLMSIITFGLLFGLLGVLAAIPIVADLVVVWQYMNRHLEKDTTEYDVVNAPAGETPVQGSRQSRGFKNLFRRAPQGAKV
jgi:predicted PurR-regulated permease PerM